MSNDVQDAIDKAIREEFRIPTKASPEWIEFLQRRCERLQPIVKQMLSTTVVPAALTSKITPVGLAVCRAMRADLLRKRNQDDRFRVKNPRNRELLSIVLEAYDAGVSVIPVQDSKHPFPGFRFTDWYHDEFRPSRDEVELFFKHYIDICAKPMGYGVLMGAASGNIIGFDCDTPLSAQAFHAEFPDHPCYETTTNGKGHFYWRVPPRISPYQTHQLTHLEIEFPSGRIAGPLVADGDHFKGVDIKGQGTFCVFHGSHHLKTGGRYHNPNWPIDLSKVPYLPLDWKIGRSESVVVGGQMKKAGWQTVGAWVEQNLQRVAERAEVSKRVFNFPRPASDGANDLYARVAHYMTYVPGATKGNRHPTAYWIARFLLSDCTLIEVSLDDAKSLLYGWNQTCEPEPLPERDIEKIFNDALHAGRGEKFGRFLEDRRQPKPIERPDHPDYRRFFSSSDAEIQRRHYPPAVESPKNLAAEAVPSKATIELLDDLPDFLSAKLAAAERGTEAGDDVDPDADPKPPPAKPTALNSPKRKWEWSRINPRVIEYARQHQSVLFQIEKDIRSLLDEPLIDMKAIGEMRKRASCARSNLLRLIGCQDFKYKLKNRWCAGGHQKPDRFLFCKLNGSCRFCAEIEAKIAKPFCLQRWTELVGPHLVLVSYNFSHTGSSMNDIERARKILTEPLRKSDLPHRWVVSHEVVTVVGDPKLYNVLAEAWKPEALRATNDSLLPRPFEARGFSVEVVPTATAVDAWFRCFLAAPKKMYDLQCELLRPIVAGWEEKAAKVWQKIIDFPFLMTYRRKRHTASKTGKELLPYPSPKVLSQLKLADAAKTRPWLIDLKPGECGEILVDGSRCKCQVSHGTIHFGNIKIHEFPSDQDVRTIGKAMDGVILTVEALLAEGTKRCDLQRRFAEVTTSQVKDQVVAFGVKVYAPHPRI